MIAIRLACLTLGLIGAGRCLAQNPVIAIEAARLIDGTGREPIENAVVLVKGDKIECSINKKVVASYDKSVLVTAGKLKSTDGVYGIRFAHNTEVFVTGLKMTKN